MSFGADTPFLLLARIQVKPDKVQEYLLLAAKTDKAVEDSEPGMLHHTFDQDPENPLRFVWSEVYKNDDAFLAHLANPSVGEYLQGHAELGDNFTVEVYGTVGHQCKAAMQATGLPLKIFESKFGYSRV
ncbi:putative quinol monooxygenase [Prochlorococcus marinus]|uniref:putative quinol monooxygenase n=1 Tax=Prochlorococcus marinus TaxID=1219 RepID=UPI0022B3F2D1|nr:antibiotic biosynthesis monooxygenase family protein [Prochlorococcus marinus]